MSLAARARRLLWDQRPRWRLPARRLRRIASLLCFQLKKALGQADGPRVLSVRSGHTSLLPHPALVLHGGPPDLAKRLTQQTETSWTIASEETGEPHPEALDLLLDPQADPTLWPATTLESLLITAAALEVSTLASASAAPAVGAGEPDGAVSLDSLPAAYRRNPGASPLIGRLVPHLVDNPPVDAAIGPFLRSGPWLLRGDTGPQVVRTAVRDPSSALAHLPQSPGPRTVLFLLPFLAVGGAEHLLYDLLPGLDDARKLVVTLDPHRAHLGHTVERCRSLTPHVYTLGDWLPREALAGAVEHLLRRYQVETLVSWNGTVEFYDRVARWRQRFPDLRIAHQLYNHEGGWTERVTPRSAPSFDLHLAVNGLISEALTHHGVPRERIALVPHGVAVPDPVSEAERTRRRRDARRRFGLPEDAVVVGTFIRLHPQKRPLDLIALARRLAPKDVHFLLAGGGPLEAQIDYELTRQPLPNFHRQPFQRDVESLYDATDICLSTSRFEGLPVFLLDALARRVPVVSTAVGDIPDLLRDGGGLLVERPGDLESLEQALLTLLDPKRRREEGDRGHATVAARFGLEAYRKRYRDLLLPPAPDGGSHHD